MPKLRILLVLVLLSLAVYSNVLHGAFVLDDANFIVTNDYIKHFRTIPLLFVNDAFKFYQTNIDSPVKYYRPIMSLSFALDYLIWRLNPFGYHLVNIIIHSLVAYLLFYFILLLFNQRPLAILTGLFFCLHPIQTETVAFVSARSELLVSLFTLLSLVLYIRYLDTRKGLLFASALLSFALALLSREGMFLAIVPFFAVALGSYKKVSRSSIILHFLAYGGILATYLLLRLTILVPLYALPQMLFPPWVTFLNFISALMGYITLFIFPYPLHVFRSMYPLWAYQPAYLLFPLVFFLCVSFIVIRLLRQKQYIPLFGLGWFVFALLHLLLFMYKFSGRVITMEEHWAYLPSAGFFLVLAYGILHISKKYVKYLAAGTLMFAWAGLTVFNNTHWQDALGFYRYNLKFVDDDLSSSIRSHYIITLANRGLSQEALRQVDAWMAIKPAWDRRWCYFLRGIVYVQLKQYPQAKEAFETAVNQDPFFWVAHRALADIAAATHTTYSPGETYAGFSAREGKIICAMKMGEFDKVYQMLTEELAVSKTPNLYILSGIACGQVGDFQNSLRSFNAALAIDPNNKLALSNLASTYQKMWRFKEAQEIMEKITQTNSKISDVPCQR